MASSFDRLKELNLSRDEVNRIGEALKNPEFRTLLTDYVEEIQDPKNRQIYEEEVKQFERERGQEVTFLHPTAGYVIKTSVNGSQKCFINICSNENINKPSSSPTVKNGAKGLQWSLPHSLSPPREDIDNKGVRCQVYDVLFHPDTLHLASNNREFYSMVNDVALDAVENNFNVNLDKKNLKFPKMLYKGLQRASILRKPSKEKPTERTEEEQELYNKIYSEIDSQRYCLNKIPKTIRNKKIIKEENSLYTTPKYIIKHRSHIDIQEFTEHKNAKLNATVPKELIIEINLPLLKNSSDMDLDVTEKTIQLTSEKPAKYKLNVTLPYHVIETSGTAKFDKDLKKLVITLPVKRKNTFETTRDDSGIESCIDSDANNSASPQSDEYESDNISEIQINKSELVQKVNSVIRTHNNDDFLNAQDLYNIPEFSCNIFNNIVAFTFNVKNVDENTLSTKCRSEDSLIKIKFTSISSSFYQSYYTFCVKFPEHQFFEEKINAETWDNNVILHIPIKTSAQPLTSYFYGINEEDLLEKFIEESAVINKQSDLLAEQSESQRKNDNEDTSEKLKNDLKLEKHCFEKTKSLKPKSEAIDIFASSYSSGDELSASSFSPQKGRGILKRISRARSNFGRSISESSLDDFLCSSYENYHGSIDCVPEDSREDDTMSSSLKKTVRFNDVVTKQLFRSNSSILGQKKKNQRKARNKKRAHERRYSESEASDVENKRERDNQTTAAEEISEVFAEIATDKKDDNDIFHLEINN